MKIRIFLTGLTLLMISVTGFSQGPGPGPLSKEARQRIEAQRIGFITQKLNLTPEEATKFWPIYNEYKDALRDMKDDMERPDLMSITDDEATAVIERHLQQEQKRLELKKKLFSQLRNVISSRKIILLQASEREFNRGLLQRVSAGHMPEKGEKMN